MKSFISLILICGYCLTIGQIPFNGDPIWELTRNDEFNYTANYSTHAAQITALTDHLSGDGQWIISGTKWGSPSFVSGASNAHIDEFGNEINFHIDLNNSTIGFVTLGARKATSTEQFYYPCQYGWNNSGATLHHPDAIYAALTSSAIFKYGAFEIRFRLPDINLDGASGGLTNFEKVQGYVQAFWLFPKLVGTQYKEIDFFENNFVRKNEFQSNMHLVPISATSNNNG